MLFAASGFPLMANILPRDATKQLEFMIRTLVRRYGMSAIDKLCEIVRIENVIISVLVDETAGQTGRVYVRSLCFSPDGKFLATGGEDKQIRVRMISIDAASFRTLMTRG